MIRANSSSIKEADAVYSTMGRIMACSSWGTRPPTSSPLVSSMIHEKSSPGLTRLTEPDGNQTPGQDESSKLGLTIQGPTFLHSRPPLGVGVAVPVSVDVSSIVW